MDLYITTETGKQIRATIESQVDESYTFADSLRGVRSVQYTVEVPNYGIRYLEARTTDDPSVVIFKLFDLVKKIVKENA